MAKVSLKLVQYVASRNKKVEKVFDDFVMELAQCGIPYSLLPTDDLFSFDKYPVLSKVTDKLLKKYRDRLQSLMIKSLGGAIDLAIGVLKAEFQPFSLFSDYILDTHRNAFSSAFLDYRMKPTKGLSLSDRVWNYMSQTKAEFELGLSQALEDGIRSGESAEEIGKKIRDKLRNPDMMYRRYHSKKILKNGTKKDVVEWRRKVVGSDGKVHFIKEDLAKTGQGVYRSARQNALRMAGTEINMAYRYGEVKELQKDPFVLGYKICLSNNHTCKDGDKIIDPYHDMCNDLEGVYPKWFMWSGWHPRCRCHIEAVLCSEDEMRYISRLPKEQYEKYKSPNLIKDLPSNYNDYMEANKERIERSIAAGTQPYWIEDNYVDGDPSKGFKETMPEEPTTLEKAKDRHAQRTPQQIAEIQKRWDKRKETIQKAELRANEVLADAERYPFDVDTTRLKSLVEKRQFLQTNKVALDMEDEILSLDKRVILLNFIPNASSWTKTYSVSELESVNKSLDAIDIQRIPLPLIDQRTLLNNYVSASTNDAQTAGLNRMLKDVEKQIKIEEFKTRLDKVKDLYQRSHIETFDLEYESADDLIGFEDETQFNWINDILTRLEQLYPLVKRYEDLLTFQSASKPFVLVMEEAKEALETEDFNTAVQKIAAAEARRAQIIRDRAWADKQKNKGKKSEEATEEETEEEKMKLTQANGIADIRKILGSKTPVMLKHYETSITRNQYTKRTYISKWKDAGPKLKDFFMNKVAWAHAFSTDLISGYAETGIWTTFQASDKGGGYNNNRYMYGHGAFGFNVDFATMPSEKEKLKPGDYYRCGKPVDKNDMTKAYHQRASGYGENMVIFRKDKVVALFTQGNSLGSECIPSLVCDPKPCSIDRQDFDCIDDESYDTPEQVYGNSYGYTEMQFLPMNGDQYIGLDYFEAVVVERYPLDLQPQSVWDKYYEHHVDVYYMDRRTGKVVLFKKGKPMETADEMKARLSKEIPEFVTEYTGKENKDVNLTKLQQLYDNGEYEKASDYLESLKEVVKKIEIVKKKVIGLLPDFDDLHQQFTLAEIEGVYDHVKAQFDKWSAYGYEKFFNKVEFEISYIEKPENQMHSTWWVARDMYLRKREELLPYVKKMLLKKKVDELKNDKYSQHPDMIKIIEEIEKNLQKDNLSVVEDLIDGAQKLISYLESVGTKAIGVSDAVVFDSTAFDKATIKKAIWFKDDNDHQKGFNAADKYMSQYAQEAWNNMSKEEKIVAYNYTSGSRYVNEPLDGKNYSITGAEKRYKGVLRSSERDINTLTSVIDKAPALKDGIWVQHAEDIDVFENRFGFHLKRQKTQDYMIGKEAVSNSFLSTSAAKYSFFTDPAKTRGTVGVKKVVLSIYLPAGTKGLYCEPFACYGDGKTLSNGSVTDRYGEDGINWDGSSRQEQGRAAGDQVEFLLQRGSKLRITKANYDSDQEIWFIECWLVGQQENTQFHCGY